jgi:hypothetical protein
MGTPVYMTIEDACNIVKDYAGLHTGGDLLEAVKDMQACYDDLDRDQQVAYTKFSREARRFFASNSTMETDNE